MTHYPQSIDLAEETHEMQCVQPTHESHDYVEEFELKGSPGRKDESLFSYDFSFGNPTK